MICCPVWPSVANIHRLWSDAIKGRRAAQSQHIWQKEDLSSFIINKRKPLLPVSVSTTPTCIYLLTASLMHNSTWAYIQEQHAQYAQFIDSIWLTSTNVDFAHTRTKKKSCSPVLFLLDICFSLQSAHINIKRRFPFSVGICMHLLSPCGSLFFFLHLLSLPVTCFFLF